MASGSKKGEFEVGKNAIYFEIDSWIPHWIAPFLTKPGQFPKVYNGVEGQRLKTIKLKGQISQGLLLPLPEHFENTFGNCETLLQFVNVPVEGFDLTEALGIQKWERPEANNTRSTAKGNFPYFIPKTDQERVQNLSKQLDKWKEKDYTFEITEKLDGSSMTVYVKGETSGVCSRNLELKDNEESPCNWWKVTKEQNLIGKLSTLGRNLAIQGELIGPGIQGNKYGITELDFYCYDIFDIDNQVYLDASERQNICVALAIKHVPFIGFGRLEFIGDTASILAFAESKSFIGTKPEREGVVFKCTRNPSVSFKAISNKWLLKYE